MQKKNRSKRRWKNRVNSSEGHNKRTYSLAIWSQAPHAASCTKVALFEIIHISKQFAVSVDIGLQFHQKDTVKEPLQ